MNVSRVQLVKLGRQARERLPRRLTATVLPTLLLAARSRPAQGIFCWHGRYPRWTATIPEPLPRRPHGQPVGSRLPGVPHSQRIGLDHRPRASAAFLMAVRGAFAMSMFAVSTTPRRQSFSWPPVQEGAHAVSAAPMFHRRARSRLPASRRFNRVRVIRQSARCVTYNRHM